jgi:hypothetical protein
MALPLGNQNVPLHGHFPIQDPSQVSPPTVAKPIHQCQKVVHVSGFVPHADVTVYANGTEIIGFATPYFGYGDIALTREANTGENITATQTINGLESVQSSPPCESFGHAGVAQTRGRT